MGASQSIDSASERQMKEVGPFMLRSSQKGALKILSKIVEKLLTENNLFNLPELLTSPEKCGKLFIVISTTVKKEFQLLKFPDPRNPSHMATMSFLSSSAYPPKGAESEAARNRACNEITHFLIRLVTLATACTASITRNDQIASLLDVSLPSSEVSGIEKSVRDIPSTISFTNSPLDQVSIKYLEPKFNKVDPTRRPNLYRFGQAYTYIIDINKSIIYNTNTSDNRTPIFKISFKLLTNQKNLLQVSSAGQVGQIGLVGQAGLVGQVGQAGLVGQVGQAGQAGLVGQVGQIGQAGLVGQAGQAGQAGLVGQVGQAGPVGAQAAQVRRNSNNISNSGTEKTYEAASEVQSSVPPQGSTFSAAFGASKEGGRLRKTRRRRGARRQTRRRTLQRGGDLTSYVECTIEETPFAEFRTCESGCINKTFIIDKDGNTYDIDTYRVFQQSTTPLTISSGYILPFDERVKQLAFDRIMSHKATTVEFKERTELSKDRFKPLTGASEETFKSLQDYASTMLLLKTGSAPAPYRAFMLASRIAGEELTTFFCEDSWEGQYTTATISYSLLQALYDDGVAGTTPSPRSLDACKAAAQQFIGAQVAISGVQPGSVVENFHNIKFTTKPTELDAYCKTRAPQVTSSSADKRALIAGQRSIRELYDKHITDMVNIMKKVMYVTTDPSDPGSMNIHLNDVFNSDPAGGLVALERIITEARTLITTHFLLVEKAYVAAITRLSENRKGSAPPNVAATSANLLMAPSQA
jgi:hypothetical protein